MPDRDRPLILSIDAGTTKFRACVLNERLDVVWVEEVVIDDELPEYGCVDSAVVPPSLATSCPERHREVSDALKRSRTRNGVYTLGDCITCPSELRLKALDLLLEKLARECPDPALLSRVRAVSGAGQPHTLHYLLPAFTSLLTALDESPTSRLSSILTTSSAFALEAPATSSDSSTSSQVRALEQHFGQLALASSTTATSPAPNLTPSTVSEAGRIALAQRTGSRPWTRFSAAQLLKVRQEDERDSAAQGKGVLERTARIVLESGLLASVFLGRLAPVDAADACLTNLFDPLTCDWDDEMLQFLLGTSDSDGAGGGGGGGRLREMLGAVERDGGVELGKVSSYFVKRFGFSPECIVAPFTGTDPATFLSFPLATSPGRRDALVSLSVSDSDTLMVPSPAYIPLPERHLMLHPAKASWEVEEGGEEYVAMVSSKDAAVGRALSRDLYCNGQWSVFTHLTAIVPHGGTLGGQGRGSLDDKYFSFFFPHGEASIARGFLRFGSGARIPEFPDRKANPRLLLESQFLSLRIRLSHIYATLASCSSSADGAGELAALPGYDPLGFPALSSAFLPTRLVLVGPAAQNPAMSSILATIFNAPAFLPLASGLRREAVQGEEIAESYVGREGASERKKTTSSALGAGYKAAWAWARSEGEELSFGQFLERMIEGLGSEEQGGEQAEEDDPLAEGQYSHQRPATASSASAGPSHLSLLHDSAGGSSTSAYYGPAATRGGLLKAEETVEGREQQLEDDPPGLTLVAMPDWDEWRYYSSSESPSFSSLSRDLASPRPALGQVGCWLSSCLTVRFFFTVMPEYVRLERSASKGLV
ncbi:SPOSA6832_03959, partial [Sporobolomyces salmonicolor]